jgi:hypothetical protein
MSTVFESRYQLCGIFMGLVVRSEVPLVPNEFIPPLNKV